MIPILFEKDEIAFTSNGIARLRDMISCLVTEERNGIYELDFTYPIDGAHFDDIIPGRIVGVTHDESGEVQPFDIVSYEKPIGGVASFHAVHISYRQSFLTVVGQEINSLADAFDLLENALPANPFNYSTDKDSTGWLSGADGTPKSVRSLLGGSEGSILDCYGGEYEWDKFSVILHKNRGIKRDLVVRYGVNMTKYQDETDYFGTFTSCIPFWNGGEGDPVVGDKITMDGLSYNGRDLCVPLDLTDRYEDAPTVAQLNAAALRYMTNKQTNLPKQNIQVDFLRLQDFAGYEEYEDLMACNLCDTISVLFPRYGMEGSFKIVRVVWDVLEGRYTEMELGALRTSLAEALSIDSGAVISGGSGTQIYYGTCSTPAANAAKVASVMPDLNVIEAGALVFIKFTYANGVANPTLNVNSTGAISIKRYGTTAPSTSAASSWNAGSVVAFVYDGTYWQMVGWINTTYSAMTQAEMQAGTSTTARNITAARLKEAILYWATPANIGAMSSSAFVAGSYVYNGASATSFSFQDAAVDGKTHIICGCQDAGNPPFRASISGDTITVYLSGAVTLMRVNYICY